MKKRLPALLAACVLLTGCADADEVSTTESAELVVTTQTDEMPEESAEPVQSTSSITTAESAEPAVKETVEPTAEVLDPSEDTAEAIPESDPYIEYIAAYDNTFLGLPQKDKVYIFQNTGTAAEIEGELYYCLSCYDEHEGMLYFMCDYYISEDGSKVYRYYVAEDRYSLLPETSSGYVQMDPTTQTPEEIFTVANALYGYFDVCALDGYYDRVIEKDVNGSVWKYYMVSDERLDTKAEMLNALSCYFSMDIINSLMDTPSYMEGEDGKLYSAGGARGTDITHVSTEYELSILTADTAEFTAYSTYDDNGTITENTIIYSAVKRDGRWYFTNFELPY